MLKTRLCDLLGIEYPIIQGPMNWISGADLVAAVSNTGGLGTLGLNAGQKVPSRDPVEVRERLRSQVNKVRSLTGRPFAVNVVVSMDPQMKPFCDGFVRVCMEEKVAAAVVVQGAAHVYTRQLHEAGVKVLHAVTTPHHAVQAEKAGVDAVIAEGYEGGGHVGNEDLTTMTLVPQVVDAVKIPVVAGGGITDARGFLAALSLGAEGILMGTRFVATRESDAHTSFKEAIVKATDACTITYGGKMGGGLTRQLKNEFSRRFIEAESRGASQEELLKLWATFRLEDGFAFGRMYHSFVRGDMVEGIPAAGQVSSLIHEVAGAGEVVATIIKEAKSILIRLNKIGL